MLTHRLNSSVMRLTMAQALAGANSTVVYATAAIIGHILAPQPALATLPISVFVIGMALATLPVGAIARYYGRRCSFLIGNACGVAAGLLAALAIVVGSFALFCFAMLFGGAYAAVVLTFRFAAAECVAPDLRPKAISAVLAGGVAAGVLGPQLVTLTMSQWPPHTYAITYLAAAAVALLSALVLRGIRFEGHGAESGGGGRSLSLILRQPRFLVAILSGVVSYTVMNFMMTSAPLAMDLCGIPRAATNLGVEWHVIAMYAPSFFTGRLISRFGTSSSILAGLVLLALGALVGLSGVSVNHFWLSLVLIGVGWNFGFLGASALVLTCHTAAERTRVQSLNDFTVFGAMVVGSFTSGSLLTAHGWATVCVFMIPPVALAAIAIITMRIRRPSQAYQT